MTGSLSRCIPQPGCRPGAQNSTMMPSNSTENPVSPGGSGSSQQPAPETGIPTNPPSGPEEPSQAPTTQPPQPTPSPAEGGVPSKARKPKERFFLQNDDIIFQNDLI